MLGLLLFFLSLLILLFFLTRTLTNLVFRLFVLITRRQKIAIALLTALLLPGTVIHELSHLVAAFVLRVPAGKLTVIPKIISSAHSSGMQSPPTHGSGEVKEVQAGSIMVGKTDPFRLTLIGLAPLPIGIALLYAVSFLFFPSFFEPITNNQQLISDWLQTAYSQPLTILVGMYLLFSISCSMFSSKKDLKALLISGPIVAVAIGLLYWGGIRIGISPGTLVQWSQQIRQVNGALGITAGVDAILLIILLVPQYIGQRMRRYRHFSS